MTMKYTSKEESILHYLRKIVLHGKGKVTMRGSVIRQRTRRERSSLKKKNVDAEKPLSVK
jgi:hypothetical protein